MWVGGTRWGRARWEKGSPVGGVERLIEAVRPRLPGGGDGVGGEQRGGTGSGPGIGTGIALARRLRLLGCMTQTPSPATQLPHHERIAHQLCLAFVTLVARTRVGNAQRRAQARKSAASAPLHGAEGAPRQTRADRTCAHAIALCECCEACAAVEIAGALGACSAADVAAVLTLGRPARPRDLRGIQLRSC